MKGVYPSDSVDVELISLRGVENIGIEFVSGNRRRVAISKRMLMIPDEASATELALRVRNSIVIT